MTKSRFEIAAIMDDLRDLYIGTASFAALQDHLQQLFRVGEDGELTHEPILFTAGTEAHGVILIAGPGTGKTMDLVNVLRDFKALAENPDTGMPRYIRVSVESPATLRSLACQFLEELGIDRVSERTKVHELWAMVRKLLNRRGITLVVVDEAHDMFRGASATEADAMFRMMKSLMKGDHPVALILAGTERLRAITRLDGQVNRRFSKIIVPPLDVATDGDNVREMIGFYADGAGLAVSLRDDVALRLIHGSRCRFGRCVETTIAAVKQALDAGSDTLTAEHFEMAWGMAEGCPLTANVFAVDDFMAIELEDDDEIGERMQEARAKRAQPTPKSQRGKKKAA